MKRLLVLVGGTGAVEALEWLQFEYADCLSEFTKLQPGTAPDDVVEPPDDTVAVVVVRRDEVSAWVNKWARESSSAVLVCFRTAPDEGTRWYRQMLSAGIKDGHSGAVKIAVGCRDTCAFEISCLCRCDIGPFDITEYRSRIEPRCPMPSSEPPADEGRPRKRRRSSSGSPADPSSVEVVVTSERYERPYILTCPRGSIPEDTLEAAFKSDKTFHFTSSRPDEFTSAAWDLYFGIVALDEDRDGLPDGRPNPVKEFHGGEIHGCLYVEWE
jgi:hypothetical protein